MPVDLDRDDSVGIWTEFPEFAGERFKIRPLSPQMIEHFRKQTTKEVVNRRTGQKTEERDEERYNGLLWDHLLEDWELTNSQGTPWPCTLANKLKLADRYATRVTAIVQAAMDYANDDAVRQEAERVSFRDVGEAQAGLSGAGLSDLRSGDSGVAGTVSAVPTAPH